MEYLLKKLKKIEDLKVELKEFIINTPSVRRRRTATPFKKGEFKGKYPVVAYIAGGLPPLFYKRGI